MDDFSWWILIGFLWIISTSITMRRNHNDHKYLDERINHKVSSHYFNEWIGYISKIGNRVDDIEKFWDPDYDTSKMTPLVEEIDKIKIQIENQQEDDEQSFYDPDQSHQPKTLVEEVEDLKRQVKILQGRL